MELKDWIETKEAYNCNTVTPKEDGVYMVRMETKNNVLYDFVTYYSTRGWLTNRLVTHFIEIEVIDEEYV